MQPFPHHYTVAASGSAFGDVALQAERLATLHTASPAEFGGPGDRWSPEMLLVGAIADCFILTFRSVARASGLAWTSLECEVTGTLDRAEKTTRFVAFEIRPHLEMPPGTDPERARMVLEKTERACLITNSLSGAMHLVPRIEVAEEPVGV